MLFAVIQDKFLKLAPAEVSAAYEEVFNISKIDAQARILKQPCGILAFGLEEAQAELMVSLLTSLAYPCYKRQIDKLVEIHKALPVFSAMFCEEGIIFENLFGEQKRILWNHLQMIEVFSLRSKLVSLQNRKKAKRIGKPSTVTIKKEQLTSGKFIEIYSDSPFPRLQIEASKFNYSSLRTEMTSDSQVNLKLLIAQIKQLCEKFAVSFTDSSNSLPYSDFTDFEIYSHWKLQGLDV